MNELGALNQGGDSLEAVWAADLVVGMTTMLLMETLLLQRPHLSIIPRSLEAGWLPTLELGLTPVAKTREDIIYKLGSLDNDLAIKADTLPCDAVEKVLELVTLSLSPIHCS